MMLIKDILTKKENFSETEKQLGDYILEKGFELKNMSIRQLAEDLYISPATIIRFCKKIGFSGYNEFKDSYTNELNYLESNFEGVNPNYPFEKNDAPLTIAYKMKNLYQEIINDCLSLMSHDQLQKITRLIEKTQYFYVVASSSQKDLASTIKEKMTRIGKQVTIFSTSQETYYRSCYLQQENVCFILISYTGETCLCINTSKVLNQRNIPFFVITSYGSNTLSKLTDNILYVSTKEKLVSNLGAYSFNLSVLYLFDIIYSICFNADYDTNLKNKRQYMEMYESQRKTDNPLLQDDETVFTK